MTNIPLMIAGGVFLVMLIVIGWLAIANANLKTEIAVKETSIATLTSTNHQFKDDIEANNKTLENMRLQAAQRARDVEKAREAARVVSDRYKKISALIANMKPVNKDDCTATNKLVTTYFWGQL